MLAPFLLWACADLSLPLRGGAEFPSPVLRWVVLYVLLQR